MIKLKSQRVPDRSRPSLHRAAEAQQAVESVPRQATTGPIARHCADAPPVADLGRADGVMSMRLAASLRPVAFAGGVHLVDRHYLARRFAGEPSPQTQL